MVFEASENGIDDKLIRTRYQQSVLVSYILRTSTIGLPSLRFQFIGDLCLFKPVTNLSVSVEEKDRRKA